VRVNSFSYKGHKYYHSGKYFYSYHPEYGYRIVDAPYTQVRRLPGRYKIVVFNGSSYPYYNGYYYLPSEYGYVMVPAPAKPQFSFNVALNF